MSVAYQKFMIFMLHDSGEKDQIDITKTEFLKDNGKNVLFPRQVVLIIDEELRRIYIWKGAQSSVRKKFIASRVASELQKELTNLANFHRCKVVSVDQGDEPDEFLHSFGFSSLKNNLLSEIEQPQNDQQLTISQTSNSLGKDRQAYKLRKLNIIRKLSQDQRDRLNILLKSESPPGFSRQHVILGDSIIYGLVEKKTEVFGKKVSEESWSPIDGLNEEMIEFNDYKVRVYFDTTTKLIKAVEFLKPKNENFSKKELEEFSNWTVKELKAYCIKNDIKVLSKYRKADLVKLVEQHNKSIYS
jgi:hypothetical protein